MTYAIAAEFRHKRYPSDPASRQPAHARFAQAPPPRRADRGLAGDLVAQDHVYRHLEAKLDLGFVQKWSRDLYADRGRPSIDPAVFFKLQVVTFFEGIRSDRKLIETANLNLAHLWYLGCALDQPLLDHWSLIRIRQRLGIDVFQRFFDKVADLCQDAGLVWGGRLRLAPHLALRRRRRGRFDDDLELQWGNAFEAVMVVLHRQHADGVAAGSPRRQVDSRRSCPGRS